MSTKYILLSFLLALPLVAENEFKEHFDAGNLKCRNESYQTALSYYQKALELGSSSSLHYNLAYAYFKTNDSGRAIYHNTKALLIDPSNPDIAANLRFVREAAGVEEPTVEWIQWLAYRANLCVWVIIATSCFWLAAILFVFPKLCAKDHIYFRLSAWVCATFCILSMIALYGWHGERNKAIILKNETALRVSPTSKAEVERYLSGGAMVETLEFHENYTKIITDGVLSGWVESDAVGLYYDYKK